MLPAGKTLKQCFGTQRFAFRLVPHLERNTTMYLQIDMIDRQFCSKASSRKGTLL